MSDFHERRSAIPIAAFDTMGVAERLSGEFDVPDKQARGIARVMHDSFVSDVATKDDIAAIRKDSRNLDEKLGGRIDHVDERLGGKIDHVEEKLGGRIDHVEEKLGGRIDHLEEKLGGDIARLDQKIDHLEVRLTGKIEQVADRLAIQMLRQNFVLALGMVGLLFAMMKLFL